MKTKRWTIYAKYIDGNQVGRPATIKRPVFCSWFKSRAIRRAKKVARNSMLFNRKGIETEIQVVDVRSGKTVWGWRTP